MNYEQLERKLYDDMCACDNQDIPLEEWPTRLISILLKDGALLIAAERQRQIEQEGFNKTHDDKYNGTKPGALTMGAICYSTMAGSSPAMRDKLRVAHPLYWPWNLQWWKPGKDNTNASRIRELVKAGALLAAEIDRLQREADSHAN